jgi:soluble lytic murein transglycosylase
MKRISGRKLAVIAAPLTIVAAACLVWFSKDSIRSPEALYAEAQVASSRRAEELYGLLAKRLPEIADYAQLWQAEAALPDPEAFRSIQLLADLRPENPVAYLAKITTARYYADIDASVASDAYRAALDLHESPSLRLELARFYEERGDHDAAYAEYRELLPVKADAFAGMRRNSTDTLQLAEDLNDATYFRDALEVLRDVRVPEASRLRGLAYLGLGQYQAAAQEFKAWMRTNPASKEERLGVAEALAQFGQAELAVADFGSIDADAPEIKLVQAGLLETVSPDEAIRLYESLPYPVGWWNATWLLEAQGRSGEAMELYSRIAASDTYFADDAAYRLMILGARSGDSSAVAQAKGYLESFGLNWLALRASVMEAELPTAPSVEPTSPEITRRVESLDRLGRGDLADLELLFCSEYRRDLPVRVACLQGLAARGKVTEAEAVASEMVAEKDRLPAEVWRLAFPEPYAEAVQASAKEFGIDPLLIWSVMRVESRYDPSAVSAAGARGLMQIIPDTQEWIAQQMGLQLAPGEIFAPELNIKLGAWYLRYLMDEFDGDLELAIPAYNAGPDYVRAWLEDPMVKDKDDFIRWIGFGESREYLERVSIAYWVYRQAYAP